MTNTVHSQRLADRHLRQVVRLQQHLWLRDSRKDARGDLHAVRRDGGCRLLLPGKEAGEQRAPDLRLDPRLVGSASLPPSASPRLSASSWGKPRRPPV